MLSLSVSPWFAEPCFLWHHPRTIKFVCHVRASLKWWHQKQVLPIWTSGKNETIRTSLLPSSGYVLFQRGSWHLGGSCTGKPSALLWRAGEGVHISHKGRDLGCGEARGLAKTNSTWGTGKHESPLPELVGVSPTRRYLRSKSNKFSWFNCLFLIKYLLMFYLFCYFECPLGISQFK